MSYWPLLGVAVVIAGFALRLNPMGVVTAAALVTGLAAGIAPLALIELLGEAFARNRFLAIFLLALPVIGLLERHGLRDQAEHWVGRLRGATAGRVLMTYHALRQLAAAVGLNSIGGHAQTVRPLLAPMVEGAAHRTAGTLPDALRMRLRALSAATDNIALFFGEDIFIAFGAVLLMQGFFADRGIALEPLAIALWGIPTALCAYAIHALRLQRLDREIAALARANSPAAPPAATASAGTRSTK